MAEPGDSTIIDAPKLPDIAQALAAEFLSPHNAEKVKSIIQDSLLENQKNVGEMAMASGAWLAGRLARLVLGIINAPEPVYQELARTAIDTLLGEGQGHSAPSDSGRKLIARISGGGGGEMQPGIDGAANYLTLMLGESMEGWVRGVAVEIVTEFFPTFGVAGGGIETAAKLEEIIEGALGGQRMIRRVIQPFMNATAITPAQWHVNKTYRPELLGVGEAVRQFHRGRWTRERIEEELARQGWSSDRIDAFINAGKKFFGVGDVRTFVDRDHWAMDKGIQHLRDQGYDEESAVDALRLEGIRRIERLEDAEASAIIAAYVDRRIQGGEFRALLNTAVKNPQERALLEELAEVRRTVNIKHVSPAEAKACVKVGVLSVIDYRRALEREGYVPEAVAALELLLRHELDEKRALDDLRAAQAAERAAEELARDVAAAARRAEIEADRARRRRGPVADLERAVIRGLIPFDRLQEVLAADYDADTVAIMLDLVEGDRQRYLEQLARADDARKRAELRSLDVGGLERAVMAGLLTPAEFTQRLAFLKFDPADAALLTAVVTAKKADQDQAIARRLEAEQRAGRRRIDLSRLERLVRRGARSFADYDALLAELGFEDADRAAMRELVALQIADDRAAAAERAEAEARLSPRGLSLDQFRRAVILGTRTEDQFQRFLVDQNFTADAQAVLVADLRLAVAEAEDARRRREQPAPVPEARGLPLSTLQRAARLGIVTPDTYTDRLVELGYTDDDVAVELELLLVEIAETQAARAKRDAVEPAAEARGLSLAQVERAVRAGALTLDDYRARAFEAGLTSDAVDIVVAVLAQEVGSLNEAREVRAIVLRQLADQNVSLDELEKPVLKSGQSFDVFIGELEARGIGADEAELVASLLVDQVEAAAAKGAGNAG